MSSLYSNLNPEKALIWRITHRHNLPWILANGLHPGNSLVRSQEWVSIGNEDLINRRSHRQVPFPPGGVLNDYVPFYFTPFSPMLYNIHTGRGGVRYVPNADIVILVSSLRKVAEMGLPFVFTDRHAYPVTANYFRTLDALERIDWPLLQQRNFKRSEDDPEKVERYQAEALIHGSVPISALIGVVCYTQAIEQELQTQSRNMGINLDIHHIPAWYF